MIDSRNQLPKQAAHDPTITNICTFSPIKLHLNQMASLTTEETTVPTTEVVAPTNPSTATSKKKKKKKKKKKASQSTVNATPANTEEKQKMAEALYGGGRRRRNVAAGETKSHKFWDTQPVPKEAEDTSDPTASGPIDTEKTVDDINAEPLNLPKGFKWVSMDVTDDVQLKEIYKLLAENYVEDDDNMFRFDYSKEFLQWALMAPGFFSDWHVGVRQVSNNRLRGFITGIPVVQSVYGVKSTMAEINFLCVHKKLRAVRLAPVLIREVTRRVNRRDIWQAVYTAGIVLPKPVAACKYWHRTINPRKLISVNFSRLAPRMTMQRTIKLYRLPEEPTIGGLRALEPKDVPSARKLLNNYLTQ
jgi:glycylpeptide N-tetradecanoyltransferase